MTAAQFIALVSAETSKLFSRTSARLGLVLMAILGVLGPVGLKGCMSSGATINGAPMLPEAEQHATRAIQISLFMHNFFFAHVLLTVIGAVALAGEFQSRTLREDLLRPIPRWSVLYAKWAAMCTWAAMSTVLTLVISAIPALIIFGVSAPDWSETALGYLATIVCDCGFCTLVLLASVATRSVVGTLGGVFLFVVLDTFLGWTLDIADKISTLAQGVLPDQYRFVQIIEPWLPSSAYGAASHYATGLVWQNFASLGLLTFGCMALAHLVLSRIDVP